MAPTTHHHVLQQETDPELHDANVAWLAATAVFVALLALETFSLCRTVFWWDSGELAANVRVLGIPHRPGFPLYVLIAHVLAEPPIGTYFYRVNFVSALCASAAAAIFVFVQFRLAQRFLKGNARRWSYVGIMLATTAVIGTYTFWIQAVRAEVYTLNLLGIALIVLCMHQLEREVTGDRDNAAVPLRWWFAACFFGGLFSGAHHATFIPILPAATIMAFAVARKRLLRPSSLLTATLLFGLGLSVYFYLPVRAALDPVLNWGWAPHEGSLAWNAVLATDAYPDILAGTFHAFVNKLGQAFLLLGSQWGWALCVAALGGAIWLAHYAPRWALFLTIAVLGNVAVTAVLASEFIAENADLHGYLAPTLVMMGICCSMGLAWFFARTSSVLRRLVKSLPLVVIVQGTLIGAVALLSITPLLLNTPRCVLAHNRLAHDFGVESIAPLDRRAVVFLDDTNWDFVLRGVQHVEEVRPDVTVINRALLPSVWYRSTLAHQHPELFGQFSPVELTPDTYPAFACSLAAAGFPVYWQFMGRKDTSLVDRLMPAGHLFSLRDTVVTRIPPAELLWQEEFENESRFYAAVDLIRYDYDAFKVYMVNLYRAGRFYEMRGLYARARDLYRRALSLKPDERMIRARLDGLPVRNTAAR